MKHQRAMDDSEKSERKQQILKAAVSLLKTATFEQISMAEVARISGIAKGTVYLYFKTKEELFLALLNNAFAEWFADLQQRLLTLKETDNTARIRAFASILTDSLQEHTLLLGLLPILHPILEHNVPYAAVLDFKQGLRTNLLSTGQQIENIFAFLNPGQGAELLLSAYSALIGLLSMTQPSEIARQVLKEPEMSLFVIDRTAALRQLVSHLLMGMYVVTQ